MQENTKTVHPPQAFLPGPIEGSTVFRVQFEEVAWHVQASPSDQGKQVETHLDTEKGKEDHFWPTKRGRRKGNGKK